MRLAIVVASFSPFINSNELGMATSISKLGHDVTIITTSALDDRLSPYLVGRRTERREQDLPFSIQYLQTRFSVKGNHIAWGFSDSLRDYDALFLQDDWPFLSKLCSSFAWRKNIPFTISSERYRYPDSIPTKLLLILLNKTVHSAMWKKSVALTFHCRASMQFYSENSAPKNKLFWIPVGIDSEHFKISSPSMSSREPNRDIVSLLCVARLEDFKGHACLLHAIKKVKSQFSQIRLDLLGRGSREMMLRSLIKSLHLEDTVFLRTTPTSYMEMPEIYQSCDIYVQPSLVEPFGIALLEAMSCGKPIVASSVGGMRDTVSHLTNGILVPPGNSERLAEAIRTLVIDPELRRKMGEASEKRARETFNWRKIAAQYLDLLRST